VLQAATVLTPFAFFEAPRTTVAEIQNHYTNKPLQWEKGHDTKRKI